MSDAARKIAECHRVGDDESEDHRPQDVLDVRSVSDGPCRTRRSIARSPSRETDDGESSVPGTSCHPLRPAARPSCNTQRVGAHRVTTKLPEMMARLAPGSTATADARRPTQVERNADRSTNPPLRTGKGGFICRRFMTDEAGPKVRPYRSSEERLKEKRTRTPASSGRPVRDGAESGQSPRFPIVLRGEASPKAGTAA